ncbi:tetratricopeptide repeat protein 39B [Ceratobasidium sp. AG-Ba]|nr:tetratricopeptide repeat protein 39B [Ceratobasidium sp. AG-Ba]
MSWTSRLASFAFDASLSNARQMTIDQLHAELIYAECLLQKAIMGFVSSGDWMSFLREALNIRSVVAIYRTLNALLEDYDEKKQKGKLPENAIDIDSDFRSGVYLGMGMSLLVFSMIPSRIVIFAGLLGYKGDRFEALRLLRKAGGWGDKDGKPLHSQTEPRISKADGGARRALCDLVLVIFHLFISGFTREGVDIQEADNIVHWNLRQYPDSIFFLFGKGRLHVMRSQPDKAIDEYKKAKEKIVKQTGYEQLGSVMDWEQALCHLALGNWKESAACWNELNENSKWSKATYTYAQAACLLQSGGDAKQVEALMKAVPNLTQRIAGKSIPLEKFVARKAQLYSKGKTLVVPALELAYMLQATNRTTRGALQSHAKTLRDRLDTGLKDPDDLQLVNLLLGATLRHIDFPDSEDISEKRPLKITTESTPKLENEMESIRLLIKAKDSGPTLKEEYWIAYFAHYELGRLYEELGRYSEARQCFSKVASDTALEGPNNPRRGKYSLQNAIVLRAGASLATLPTPRAVDNMLSPTSPTLARTLSRASIPGTY